MVDYFAHSGSDLINFTDWEPLRDHLSKVAMRALEFAKEAAPQDVLLQEAASMAGLLHDLGKYHLEWQQYLRDSAAQRPTTSVLHSIHGAAHAAYTLGHQGLCMAVFGHHAGLPEFDRITNKLAVQHPILFPCVNKLIEDARKECPTLPSAVADYPLDSENPASRRRYEFWTRMLFAILVDADRLETEKFYTKQDRPRQDLAPTLLRDQLDRERRRRAEGKTGSLAELRNRVFEECVKAGEQPQGFFDLTVPTGGGKTLSGMGFALAHAERHGLRRVIVVIPYLSIIEQNAREYRQIFGPDVVVEHHSAVADDRPVPESRAIRTPAEMATENWDAPVIVTTSVQFLETLLAASPRRCRKLHNIARMWCCSTRPRPCRLISSTRS